MNTLQTLKEIGNKIPMINFIGTGDIFNLNNLSDVQYPLLWISLATNSGANGETITPRFRIYYVDRLLDDKSNQLDVEMDAMYKLNEYIYALSYQLPIQTPVQIVHFQQRFSDMCAGGYFEMNIEESMCGIELKPFEFPTTPIPKLYFSDNFTGDGSSANPITLKDEIIPSDISDLTDTQDIIPPHLFFDDTYFSGAGTQVDPKSLRTENLPSGGGGVAPKRVATWMAEETGRCEVEFTYWDNGDPIDFVDGLNILVYTKHTFIHSVTGEVASRRIKYMFDEEFVFKYDISSQQSVQIESTLNTVGLASDFIKLAIVGGRIYGTIFSGLDSLEAQVSRKFKSISGDPTKITKMIIFAFSPGSYFVEAGSKIVIQEL